MGGSARGRTRCRATRWRPGPLLPRSSSLHALFPEPFEAKGCKGMFTGIVEELGEVVSITPAGTTGESLLMTVRGPLVSSDVAHGDSIAVNGVCLTVVDQGERIDAADGVEEPVDRPPVGAPAPGARAGGGRAARVDGRPRGPIVQGHVDGAAALLSRAAGDNWD